MRMGAKISKFFNHSISVKQRYPPSQTLFGLWIDKLEEMVVKFVKEEGVEEVAHFRINICNTYIVSKKVINIIFEILFFKEAKF